MAMFRPSQSTDNQNQSAQSNVVGYKDVEGNKMRSQILKGGADFLALAPVVQKSYTPTKHG